jgi:hypothetical protein
MTSAAPTVSLACRLSSSSGYICYVRIWWLCLPPCIIYYLLLIYLLPSGAARRHLYCLSLRTGRLFYLYKLDHRRFISMPFSISLDFVLTVIL